MAEASEEFSLIFSPEGIISEWKEKDRSQKRKPRKKRAAKYTAALHGSISNKNWHETSEKHRLATWRRNDLFRIILVGAHRGEGPVFGPHVEKLMKNLTSKYNSDQPSGILFIHHQRFIHVLEGTESMVNEYLRLVNDELEFGDTFYKKARVVWYWNNISERIIRRWMWAIIQDVPGIDLNPRDVELKDAIMEIIVYILKMCRLVGQQPTMMVTEYFEKQPDEFLKLFPQHQLLDYYIWERDIPTVPTFINTYLTVPDIEYYGDMVFPLPSRHYPYD